jgi:hypothetical protein
MNYQTKIVRRRGLFASVLCGLLACSAGSAAELTAAPRDGQHDFDFEFGTWSARVSRLSKPLTGSKTWIEYAGPSIVSRVWDGHANLGEIDLAGPAGRIRGLSLRLYDPATRQWRISWASINDGLLGTPMVGGFANGRGEFYNQETFDGRAIFVRFVFSEITAKSFRLEQAFSADGGRSWEANWIAQFSR